MKKNVIAMILSATMIAGCFGPASLYAAEATTQEAAAQEEQNTEEETNEGDTSLTDNEENNTVADQDENTVQSEEGASDLTTEDQDDRTEEAGEGLTDGGAAAGEEQSETGSGEESEDVSSEAGTDEAADPDITGVNPAVVVPGMTLMTEDGTGETQNENTEEELQYCGDNITWTLTPTGSDENGPFTLTLSGSGEMYNYDDTSGSYHILSTGGPEIHSAPPWYGSCYVIDTVIVEEGITYIGSFAFSDCTSLTSITLPDSVTEIGHDAFYDCNNLQYVYLPANLTAIGFKAFAFCSGLSSVSLPDGITEIGEETFAFCENLETVDLPANLTSIGEVAFWDCHNLTSVELPYGLESIGEAAFQGCSSLGSITVPDTVTEIGVSAFVGSGLTDIKLPGGLTTISDGMFAECIGLTSVTMPDNPTAIGSGAFYQCSALEAIEIPDSVESIGDSAFEGCTGLTNVEFPYRLASIGSKAFKDCTSLEVITVPGKNTETSDDAFYGDEQLFSCYTVYYSYISSHVPTYDGTNSVTTIYYMDQVEEDIFAFTVDPIIMQVGQEIYLHEYLNGWTPELDIVPTIELSNEEVFSYDLLDDILTSTGVGETDVTITWGGKTATTRVICVDEDAPAAEGVAYKTSEITVIEGEYFLNPLVLVPEMSTINSPDWNSFMYSLYPSGTEERISDPSVITKKDFSFYAVGAGTATVSLVDLETDSIISEFEVTVEEPSCALFVEETEIEVEKGDTGSLTVRRFPTNSTDPIIYESSDSSVATVSDTGEITGVDYGFATVTVSCGNVSRVVKVTVPCPATGISLPAAMEVEYGEAITLNAVLTPSNTTDKDVEWETDDADVLFLMPAGTRCIFDGDEIGTATITGTINGYTATTVVTVVKATPAVEVGETIEAKCGQKLSELELPSNLAWQNPEQTVGSAGEYTFAATYTPDDTDHYEIVENVMLAVNVSHEHSEEWSADDTTHWHECACGDKADEDAHDYSEWTVTKEPTYTEEGTRERVCSVCGHVMTEAIPMLIWTSVDSVSLDKSELTLYVGMDDMLAATVLPEDATDNRVTWHSSDENVVTVDEYGTVAAVGAGDAVVTVTTVDEYVTAQCTVHVLKEPEILSDPTDVEALIGETVAFTVVADGDDLEYQWQWSSDGNTWKNCTNTSYNTDTFRFVMKDRFAGRRYRCIVTSGNRRLVSEAALLSLKESDEIIAHPDDVDAEVGDTVAFIVEFSGDHPTYQWQWSSDGTLWRNCTGASYDTDTFTFVMRERYAGRRYRCVVTEDGESYTSQAALLSLIQVNEILSQPDDAEAAVGETVAFIVEFSGEDPVYQWQFSVDGSYWKNCTGESYDTDTFSFEMQERFAGRMYRCVITAGGETYISDSATVSLSTDVRITAHPEDVTVANRETAEFHVEASGENLTYQWQRSSDGTTWKNCTSTGYKTDTLSFRALVKYSGRRYRCRVTSGTDKVYSECGLLTVTQ